AVKYGVTRDYIRGLEVVLPNGEVVNLGGKVVKNRYQTVKPQTTRSRFTGLTGTGNHADAGCRITLSRGSF
ncbi:MAG: hypothetical protein KHY92_07500, partial [Morganella morganii]|nr:hypothetical protein [Morganella morganii]